MMTLSILRTETGDQGTIGRGVLDTGPEFYSLELPWLDNKPDISCVIAGDYAAKFLPSKHFGRLLYHLISVPGRDLIEVHSGNFAGNVAKGWRSDVKGCLLLGEEIGELPIPGGKSQLALLRSRIALDGFMRACGGQEIQVMIRWAPALLFTGRLV